MDPGSYGTRSASSAEYAVAVLWLGSLFLAVVVCASFGGSMVRSEMSPWVWTQYARDLHRFGPADARLAVALYVVFYLSAWFLPYTVLRFVLWAIYINRDDRPLLDQRVLRPVSMSIAGGCGILFIILLEPEIAFIQHFPNPDSMLAELALLAMAALAIMVTWGGVRLLRAELGKLRVVLPTDSYLISRCSRCDHTWASPVADAKQRHLRMHQDEHTAGGYPIE